MDQAKFEDKKFSRHERKCRNVANLGGNDPLSADCLSQISAWIQIGDDGADKPHTRHAYAEPIIVRSPVT